MYGRVLGMGLEEFLILFAIIAIVVLVVKKGRGGKPSSAENAIESGALGRPFTRAKYIGFWDIYNDDLWR